MGAMYELLEAMRMPLFVKMSTKDVEFAHINQTIGNHPKLPVILRELSYQADRMLYPLLDAHENLFVESFGYKTFDGVTTLCREFGSKRLIFGGNYPYESPGAAVGQLLMADLSREDIENIAGKNMLGLIGGINYDV